MNPDMPEDISNIIIEKARYFGATLAGIADTAALKQSPSHKNTNDIIWPETVRSVLVLALGHPETEPELDWWVEKRYNTKGNRIVMDIEDRLIVYLENEHDIKAERIPYSISKGGIFFKDAAVIAGLGVMGKNNLVITPEHGPRVRFGALWIYEWLEPIGSKGFDPCAGCEMPCRTACPQEAFAGGLYHKARCKKQMGKDERSAIKGILKGVEIKYCRECEFACPIGRK